jgi:acetylornithine deacetylase
MIETRIEQLQTDSIELLKQLIRIPSFSREEEKTAELIEKFLQEHHVSTNRHLNNVWATNKFYDESKPTILLNSHHDTVKPNSKYTLNPFDAIDENGKIFGLGSNDAGASLVSLIATFIYFYDIENLKYNLCLAATAEEEISGQNGIESLIPLLGKIDSGIVGEPTQMEMAVAERGLLVIDCVSHGKAGHAAREEGENAIYKAMDDIKWIESYRFSEVSDLLGPVKMTVTVIETQNKAHNIVPAECKFVVDVRVNELYQFEDIISFLKANMQSDIKARSTRLRSSTISLEHPLVTAGLSMGRKYFGSPTSSDKALMQFPALKIGPGDSARSHTADEYIYVDEIKNGIELYIELLKKVVM